MKTVLRQQVLSYISFFHSSSFINQKLKNISQTDALWSSSRNTLKQESHGTASLSAIREKLPQVLFYEITLLCIKDAHFSQQSILSFFYFIFPILLTTTFPLHQARSHFFTICLLSQTSSFSNFLNASEYYSVCC